MLTHIAVYETACAAKTQLHCSSARETSECLTLSKKSSARRISSSLARGS